MAIGHLHFLLSLFFLPLLTSPSTSSRNPPDDAPTTTTVSGSPYPGLDYGIEERVASVPTHHGDHKGVTHNARRPTLHVVPPRGQPTQQLTQGPSTPTRDTAPFRKGSHESLEEIMKVDDVRRARQRSGTQSDSGHHQQQPPHDHHHQQKQRHPTAHSPTTPHGITGPHTTPTSPAPPPPHGHTESQTPTSPHGKQPHHPTHPNVRRSTEPAQGTSHQEWATEGGSHVVHPTSQSAPTRTGSAPIPIPTHKRRTETYDDFEDRLKQEEKEEEERKRWEAIQWQHQQQLLYLENFRALQRRQQTRTRGRSRPDEERGRTREREEPRGPREGSETVRPTGLQYAGSQGGEGEPEVERGRRREREEPHGPREGSETVRPTRTHTGRHDRSPSPSPAAHPHTPASPHQYYHDGQGTESPTEYGQWAHPPPPGSPTGGYYESSLMDHYAPEPPTGISWDATLVEQHVPPRPHPETHNRPQDPPQPPSPHDHHHHHDDKGKGRQEKQEEEEEEEGEPVAGPSRHEGPRNDRHGQRTRSRQFSAGIGRRESTVRRTSAKKPSRKGKEKSTDFTDQQSNPLSHSPEEIIIRQ